MLWRLLPITLLAIAGCTLPIVGDITPAITPAQRERAEQRNAQALAAESAKRKAIDKIIVLPSDSSRPYRVLGVVRPELHLEGCTPDKLREAALDKYGHVDAIIGYMQSPGGGLFNDPGGAVSCEGTAVVFTTGETAAPPK